MARNFIEKKKKVIMSASRALENHQNLIERGIKKFQFISFSFFFRESLNSVGKKNEKSLQE